MALFTGTYENKVDSKGRVSLPADFRAELPESNARVVYIFPSPNLEALEACDKDFMQRMADSIEDSPLFSDEENALSERVLSKARRTQIDETGRLVLHPDFIGFTHIKDKAIFVGRGSRFQIWSREKLDIYNEDVKKHNGHHTLKLKPRMT